MVKLVFDLRVIDLLFFLMLGWCKWSVDVVFFEPGWCVL